MRPGEPPEVFETGGRVGILLLDGVLQGLPTGRGPLRPLWQGLERAPRNPGPTRGGGVRKHT